MAQKKSKSSKPVAKKAPAPKANVVTSEEEAIALIKGRFPNSPSNVEYVVLENCNIFYGFNRATALKFAKKFELKHFDVKT